MSVRVGIENSDLRITDWHHEACRVMTNGDREGRIFLSHPHTNNGFFFIPHFILEKHEKGFQKTLNSRKCDMVMSFLYHSDVTARCATSVRLFVLYLSHGLVWVWENMGKTMEIPIWCVRKPICDIAFCVMSF